MSSQNKGKARATEEELQAQEENKMSEMAHRLAKVGLDPTVADDIEEGIAGVLMLQLL